MQVAIMAGGLGTRLGPLTAKIPKSLVTVNGRPFLEHQIELLQKAGARRLVLCIGHYGEQIVERFGNGGAWGVSIAYSSEGEKLLGTGGALKKAAPLLDEAFFLLWGDSYLLLDYAAIWAQASQSPLPATMVVYRNQNQREPSNVVVQGGKVTQYDKWRPDPAKEYIDNGLSFLRKEVLERIPAGEPFAIEEVFRQLAEEGRLGALETGQCFYEIGSPQGLAELEHLLKERQD